MWGERGVDEKIENARSELSDQIAKLEQRLDGEVEKIADELEATQKLLCATMHVFLARTSDEHRPLLFKMICEEAVARCSTKRIVNALRKKIIAFEGDTPVGYVSTGAWWAT